MRALKICCLAATLTLVATWATASSLGSARDLAAAGRLSEAAVELREIADSDAPAAERAAALDLLAVVRVAAGDYAGGAAAWQELASRFPDAEQAFGAHAMQGMVAELLGDPGVEVVAPAAPVPPAGAPPTPPSPAVSPPPPAAPAAVPDAAVAPAVSGKVLMAGDGVPPEVIEETVGFFLEYLRSQGVDAELAPTPIWWRRTYDMVLPAMIEASRAAGAASFVHVTLKFGHRERLIVRCVSREGGEMWEERMSGGSGFAQDHRKNEVINRGMVERLQEKLAKHVGNACLPVSGG